MRKIRLYKHLERASTRSPETDMQRMLREQHVRTSLARRYESVWLTWRCANPFCRQWTMDGAYRTGVCNFCQT